MIWNPRLNVCLCQCQRTLTFTGLTYYHPSVLYRSPGTIHTRSKSTETMFIWWAHLQPKQKQYSEYCCWSCIQVGFWSVYAWRYLYDSCIQVENVTSEKKRNFTEKYRREVSASLVHCASRVSSNKQRVTPENTCKNNKFLLLKNRR